MLFASLNQQKNAFAHLYEEYESSKESTLFIKGILEVFCEDVEATTHVRKAELQTMNTEEGIELRKLLLEMHNSLATDVLSLKVEIKRNIEMYSRVGSVLLSKTQSIFECMQEIENCEAGYEETMNLLLNKEKRIGVEVERLERISCQVEKKNHFETLKREYSFKTTNLYPVLLKQEDHTDISKKLDCYRKEHKRILEAIKENNKKQEVEVKEMLGRYQEIEEKIGQFYEIKDILRDYAKIYAEKLDFNTTPIYETETKHPIRKGFKLNWSSSNDRIVESSEGEVDEYSQVEYR